MERPNIRQSVLAGFVATLAMTVLMYSGPMMGMPKMDIAGMLGSMFGGWWIGMLEHFLNGTVIFPLIYAYLLYRVLPGQPWIKGMQWGLILWFLAQAMVMPMMGMGLFSSKTPAPLMSVMGSLFGHFIYGTLLGAIAGQAESHSAPADAGVARAPYRKVS